jgi:hypothetical protein
VTVAMLSSWPEGIHVVYHVAQQQHIALWRQQGTICAFTEQIWSRLMARRTRSRSAPPPDSAEPETEVRLSISTQVGDETFTYYANHAEIASSPHEFGLLFARMPTKVPPERLEEAMSGTLTLPCDVQILIPATMISGLIRALNTQKATYEKRYGDIHEPGGSDAESGRR